MSLEDLLAYWPYGLVAAGVLLLLYGQRDRLGVVWTWFARLWPRRRPAPDLGELTFGERMEAFRRLRQWSSDRGRQKAIDALDRNVLPELVKEEP